MNAYPLHLDPRFPQGYESAAGEFGVFIQMWPGFYERAQDFWDTGPVKCQISIGRGTAEKSVLDTAYFCFDSDDYRMGWSDIQTDWLRDWKDGTHGDDDALAVAVVLEFPLWESKWNDFVHDIDFTDQPTCITFHLKSGPPMYFDKRILMTCSAYFAKMLGNGWMEANSNEVNLRNQDEADHRVMSAVFHFMLSEHSLRTGI